MNKKKTTKKVKFTLSDDAFWNDVMKSIKKKQK